MLVWYTFAFSAVFIYATDFLNVVVFLRKKGDTCCSCLVHCL